MTTSSTSFHAKQTVAFHKDSLYFCPMGGSGEIGMNANFYGFEDQWIMVDCGVLFSRIPDAVLMANLQPLLSIIPEKKLQALVLTHAHEDHFGAVAYLWKELQCPIYATPFTAYLLREKLKEAKVQAPIIEIPLKGSFSVGPFDIRFVSLTHSIPEPNALAISTKAGTIFHTGDWKLDPHPVVGEHVDFDELKAIGDTGKVLAMVCDSTNVFEEGSSGSELDVQKNLLEAIASSSGMVVVACFASNAARLKSTYEAATACGRKVMLVGRSLLRIRDAAFARGYFSSDMNFISQDEAKNLPREKILVLSTGSQAEAKAALTRMVKGEHPAVKLAEGDTVIFSSRVIPGNEEGISHLKNQLVRWGIIIKDDHKLHVSGHPYKDELKTMYSLIRPKIAVPVHGEDRHIHSHATYATQLGVPLAITPHNGEIYRFSPELEYVGSVDTGRLMAEGNQLMDVQGPVMAERWELLNNGIVWVTLMASKKWQRITGVQVSSHGVLTADKGGRSWEQKVLDMLRRSFPEKITPQDKGLESSHARQVEAFFYNNFRKKPVVRVVLSWT